MYLQLMYLTCPFFFENFSEFHSSIFPSKRKSNLYTSVYMFAVGGYDQEIEKWNEIGLFRLLIGQKSTLSLKFFNV